MENKNYYISNKDNPHHLSVGAVVLNDQKEVLCHHFSSITLNGVTANDLYLLVRETLESGETLEEAVHRGLKEEMGAEAEIETYIGSIASEFPRGKILMQKTTLYFLCQLKNIDASKRDVTDPEAGSKITFLPIDKLIKKMKTQSGRYGRTDLDESSILEEVKKFKKLAP